MTVLDPFDMLVRLGKITQQNVEDSDLVELGTGTSTRAARLVAVGVDKDKLLQALADLTRIPVAPAEMLANAAPMKLPDSYRTTMKELLAVPIGRVDEHILDIAIADPRTTAKLRDAAIAHRPRLALEADILAALQRVFPEEEVLDPIHEPTLKNVQLAPRPISVVDEDGVAPESGGAKDTAPLGTQAPGLANDDSAPLGIDGASPVLQPGGDESAGADANAPTLPKAKAKPLSPFRLTKEQDEPTQRVRRRSSSAAVAGAGAAAPESGSGAPGADIGAGDIGAGDIGAGDVEGALTPAERVRAVVEVARTRVDDLRARFAALNTRTRAALAVIAGITALAIIVIVATAGPDESENAIANAALDAGVADVDAGTTSDGGPDGGVGTGALPVVEKPKVEQPPKKKKKRKGTRTKKKPR